jgi:aryl-phospho-beta-D-glucosidase BglC (GH1 family)
MRRSVFLFVAIASLLLLVGGCAEQDFTLDDQARESITRIHTDNTYLRDADGRYLFLHGTNVSGASKYPASLNPISYVGKPFPLDEADENFQRLLDMGFNAIRLITIWEAIEPYGSGEYDEEYLDYFEQIVSKANDYGIYCLLDMHQDGFSRWLRKYFNDKKPDVNMLETIAGHEDYAAPEFDNVVQGDGAPLWAVQLALPEKNVGGPQWGLPFGRVTDRTQTSDVPPVHWGVSLFVSLDISRSFATFFAGKSVYPNYLVDGKNIQDYLQDSYAAAWVQLAKRVKDYPNVLGYDIMNEPIGIYAVFTLYALLYRESSAMSDGALTEAQVDYYLDIVLDEFRGRGMPEEDVAYLRGVFTEMVPLPRTPEDFAAAGFPDPKSNSPHKPDLNAALALNANFNRNYIQPFYSKVGQAIQEVDENAVLFLEGSLSADDTAGIFGVYAKPMLRPEGLDQIVFAPHVYADVYPWVLEIDPTPRDFTTDEIKFRDYTDIILGALKLGAFGLGNPPTLLGEFGTYFNLNGIQDATETDFEVPANVLDNYYEVYERELVQRMVWCYSPENWDAWGEGWNQENFSILGADQEPRGSDAYTRVTPRFTSGRLISYKYNSPLAYYEPRANVPTPVQEFNLEMAGLESSAPTEITVPRAKFPDGFYVYVTDGDCHYDPERNILYWFPSDDDPDATHHIRIRPPWEDYGDRDWDYFFDGEKVVEGE